LENTFHVNFCTRKKSSKVILEVDEEEEVILPGEEGLSAAERQKLKFGRKKYFFLVG
jgi:hypothetical protein